MRVSEYMRAIQLVQGEERTVLITYTLRKKIEMSLPIAYGTRYAIPQSVLSAID